MALTLLPTYSVAPEDAWQSLIGLRQKMEDASPLAADFEQTFVATGFSSGDAESGRIFLDLPECIRWDYEGDLPKSFLLCGHVAHTWNEGEPSGRRQLLGAAEKPGLELLRLEIGELRLKYRARMSEHAAGEISIDLVPIRQSGAISEILDATLQISADRSELVFLAYHDRDGNLTRFVFTGYEPLESRQKFSPPKEMEWLQ